MWAACGVATVRSWKLWKFPFIKQLWIYYVLVGFVALCLGSRDGGKGCLDIFVLGKYWKLENICRKKRVSTVFYLWDMTAVVLKGIVRHALPPRNPSSTFSLQKPYSRERRIKLLPFILPILIFISRTCPDSKASNILHIFGCMP